MQMLSTSVLISSIAGYFLLVFFWIKTWKPKNFPPGPRGWPYIGSVLSIGPKPHIATWQWKKKYGDLYGFYVGKQPVIVMSNFETARKVFNDDITTGRSTYQYSLIRGPNSALPIGMGLIFSQGDLWKVHRRFALSTLRDLGMGKNWLEESIIAEVEGFCQILKDSNQTPFDPKVSLTNSVSNVICALIFGRKFALDDPKFSKLTGLIRQQIGTIQYEFIAMALPFFMWFPNFVRGKIEAAQRNIQQLADFLAECVEDHEFNWHADGGKSDYLSAYKNEILTIRAGEKNSFTDQQLLVSMFDLFSAGTDTVSSTILWTLIFLAENPEVMKAVQNEIDNNIGRSKMLTNDHRGLLPYTEAVVLEVQRFSGLHPVGAPHTNHEEMMIDGYTVPKGSLIVASLYSMHRDERWWKNPNQFDPNNFLDENGKLRRPPAGFAPFSLGKRACPGEALAKMELFLYIANMLRCFTVKIPPGKGISSENIKAGITLAPASFELIFVSRL